MQKLTLSICSRCRRSFFPTLHTDRWFIHAGQLETRRFRSGGARQSYFVHKRQRNFDPPGLESPVGILDATAFFKHDVGRWANTSKVRHRLESFGILATHIPPLLNTFVSEVLSGRLSSGDGFQKYQLNRFTDIPPGRRGDFTDRIFTNIFYTWASDPEMQPTIEKLTSSGTVLSIQQLYAAADLSYPAEEFYFARTLRRKIIMHVGPTNSGKTHNALRALAGARVGVYAGPLRLLAHEVWERINLGQIVPLGIKPEPGTQPDDTINMAIANESKKASPTARKPGNPKYARLCNLLTGEEHKIVDEAATLLSCTVEMISSSAEYDVAVIDEIQMIADPERGGAWTSAFMGLCAKEIHLCGEETAVPLIEKLINDTSDELVVHRYKRLTPLVVEKGSLGGDISRVRKGDCIVTFSRSSIFGLKRQVETLTGLRCAVAYGRLPPEIRSEQAALFNDPTSGYDVMIGSDAIGMGLNLKIKRIIFEAVRKFDGRVERPLSISQIKQIAGRAGRYGLHGDDSMGGFVTTLHSPDLPLLRTALATPVPSLQFAYLGASTENIASVAKALPAGATTSTMYEVNIFVSKVRDIYRFTEYPRLADMTQFIDTKGGDLTLDDRMMLMMAPIPWQDEECLEIVGQFLRMYQKMSVNLVKSLEGSPYLDTVVKVENMMSRRMPPVSSPNTLALLETLHKVLVLYMWFHLRNPVTFADHVEVIDLKGRAEKALDWCLQGVSEKRRTPRIPRPPRRNSEISLIWPKYNTSGRELSVGFDEKTA